LSSGHRDPRGPTSITTGLWTHQSHIASPEYYLESYPRALMCGQLLTDSLFDREVYPKVPHLVKSFLVA
jgi:hypothetical protein